MTDPRTPNPNGPPPPDERERVYDEALAWLYGRLRAGRERSPERMRAWLQRTGFPMPPRAVHVIGTNGKGSVTMIVAAAHTASGRRAGAFVSPHVESFTERIGVDGVPIPRADVASFVERYRHDLTDAAFFELTLLMALEHFGREKVAVAAFEAGVGARSDATAALENVECVVITRVALDHVETLGGTAEAIAADKAAGIRSGVPTVTGATGAALEVIRGVARERGSPLYELDGDDPLFGLPRAAVPPDGWRAQNARLAAAALRLGGDCDDASIARGIAELALPARAERFDVRGRTVLLDGAHNPDAARALRTTASAIARGDFVLLFGSLPRKLGVATLAELEPFARRTFLTRVDGMPYDPSLSLVRDPLRAWLDDPLEALEAAVDATPEGGLLVVAGSLHLAGTVRPRLRALSFPVDPCTGDP